MSSGFVDYPSLTHCRHLSERGCSLLLWHRLSSRAKPFVRMCKLWKVLDAFFLRVHHGGLVCDFNECGRDSGLRLWLLPLCLPYASSWLFGPMCISRRLPAFVSRLADFLAIPHSFPDQVSIVFTAYL
jgi:hypothetical protein